MSNATRSFKSRSCYQKWLRWLITVRGLLQRVWWWVYQHHHQGIMWVVQVALLLVGQRVDGRSTCHKCDGK